VNGRSALPARWLAAPDVRHALLHVFVTCACSLSLAACAATAPAARAPSPLPPARAPSAELVPATVVSPSEAIGVDELFERGLTRAQAGDLRGALSDFERVLASDALGPFAQRALFQAALAHEALGDLEAAAGAFEEGARRFPETSLTPELLVRSVRLRLHRDQWDVAAASAVALLEQHPGAAGPAERIVAYGARALGLLAQGNTEEADYFVAKGMQIVDELQLDRAGRLPRDLAALYFAQGEARRQKAEAVSLSPDPATFSTRLEERCQLLLSAQSSYSDSMRAYDAHWSAMAGYRVGELYERLHHELMAMPPPTQAGTERQRQLFEGAMRLRYSVLVSKALTMMEHTLTMAERTGEASDWVRRSATAKVELEQALQDEQAALSRLPYSRADLEQALKDIERRAARP
jgi:tetratricopeptide (TPR) repeat protein